MEWILTVEHVFDLKEYAEEKNVKLVAIKLKGNVSLWWENLKRERERVYGKGENQILEKMKWEMHKRFVQDTYQQEVT